MASNPHEAGPHVRQVIESQVTRGSGQTDNPFRVVMQYHSLDGQLLAERDPVPGWPTRITEHSLNAEQE